MAQVLESILTLLRMFPGLKSLGVFVLLLVYLRLAIVVLERILRPRSDTQDSQQSQSFIDRKREDKPGIEKQSLNAIDMPWSAPDYPQGWRGGRLP